MSNERFQNLDILKGIAILAVVMGHTIEKVYPENYIYNLVFKICYSFHMFLFVFISGYIVFINKKNFDSGGKEYIKKRFIRLMMPYLVWTLIGLIFYNEFTIYNYINRCFINPLYWFLINLFLYDIVMVLHNKFKNNKLNFPSPDLQTNP